ncbi:VanZ family protein [Actinoplanes sp. NPDC049265]|uniref:VanZ family protein n=1 Tax=Actinoplanes sp. NPDC049265 TaxID=3363902 RepID=UPI003722E5AA
MNVQTEIPAIPVLLPLVAVLVTIGLLRLRKGGRMTPARAMTVVAAAVYLAAVLRVTTLPLQIALGSYANRVPWYEKFAWIPVLTIDVRTFVLNIIMMIPLGVLLPLFTRIDTMRRVALAGLLFSAAIEIVQLLTNVFLSSGDMADVNDLLANTIGAMVGFALLTRIDLITRRSGPFRIPPASPAPSEDGPVRPAALS